VERKKIFFQEAAARYDLPPGSLCEAHALGDAKTQSEVFSKLLAAPRR